MSPVPIPNLSNAIQVSAGNRWSIVLTDTNLVYSFGVNDVRLGFVDAIVWTTWIGRYIYTKCTDSHSKFKGCGSDLCWVPSCTCFDQVNESLCYWME
jgi:hypothetical protein